MPVDGYMVLKILQVLWKMPKPKQQSFRSDITAQKYLTIKSLLLEF